MELQHRSNKHQHRLRPGNGNGNGVVNNDGVNIELMAIAAGATTSAAAATTTTSNATKPITTTTAGRLRLLRARILATSDPLVAYCSMTHVVAWGLPLVQTAIVVLAQLVDADELLGEHIAKIFIPAECLNCVLRRVVRNLLLLTA